MTNQTQIQEAVSINLTQAELFVILPLLKIPTLPGLHAGLLLGESNADMDRGAMAQALQSLELRNVIARQGEKIVIDEMVVAALGTCVMAGYLVSVQQYFDDGGALYNYYLQPDLFVRHEQPIAYGHRFTLTAKPAIFRQLLQDQLTLPSTLTLDPVLRGVQVTIDRATFDTAISSADREQMHSTFSAAHWPEAAITAFIDAVFTLHFDIRIIDSTDVKATSQDPIAQTATVNPTKAHRMEIIVGEQTAWTIYGTTTLNIELCAPEAIFDAIGSAVPLFSI